MHMSLRRLYRLPLGQQARGEQQQGQLRELQSAKEAQQAMREFDTLLAALLATPGARPPSTRMLLSVLW